MRRSIWRRCSRIGQRVVANPIRNIELGRGIPVAEWLVKEKVNAVLSHETLQGKGPSYVFRDAGIVLRHTQALDVQAAIVLA
jgi:predicted Fe-Mo cluster-binding NifX family protein